MRKQIGKLTGILLHLLLLQFSSQAQTWNSEIGCIVYSHCSSCHRPGGIGPFSLSSYFEAFQHKESIAQSVQTRMMPPFPPDQAKRKLAHANTLSAQEIDAIVSWAENNAPLGTGAEPELPVFTSENEITDPDVVRKIPNYTVNTTSGDDYRVFVLPVGNAQEKFIEAVEVVPGNREIVHHVLVFADTSQIPLQLDAADPGPGYSSFGSSGSPTANLVAGYAPGQKAYLFPPGFGARLLPNSYLCLQIHYPKGLQNQADSTSIRIRYRGSSQGIRPLQVAPVLNHSNSLSNGPLFIPANSTRTFFSSAYVPVDFTLTGINPHMHLLGKSIKAYGVKPDGDTIHLIDIPDWHFHWQGFYNFPKPLLLPAGTILKGEAVYDNTISNPYNPNSPPQNVSAGEGTSDEMMMIFFIFAPFQPGDTSIVVDESQHWPHNFEACNTFTIVPEGYSGKEELHIAPHSELVYWEIRSADGRLLRKSTSESNPQSFPVEAGLPPGIYFQTRHYASGRVYYQRLCIP
jgi:hypothetical protein